ncbi:MAG: hypothetical protein PF489_10475 [Salinivirgaceae bacterium]|jgi:hypothetical protein|nr:hypothetical protein [Salinivirgaceae bacterium]
MKNKEFSHIREILTDRASKTTKSLVVTLGLNDRRCTEQLWQWALYEEDPLKWRAAWVFEEVCLKDSDITKIYIDQIAEIYPKLNHTGLRRMFGHILAEKTIPVASEPEILNAAFLWLQDRNQPAAVRVHCMQIIFNLSEKYLEIKQELKATLEHEYATGSPGFQNRSGKILALLKKT